MVPHIANSKKMAENQTPQENNQKKFRIYIDNPELRNSFITEVEKIGTIDTCDECDKYIIVTIDHNINLSEITEQWMKHKIGIKNVRWSISEENPTKKAYEGRIGFSSY